ncbi:MAG: hypothetical protein AVDCRST_MAG19-2871 [uncultured Thermomicrobiales bacterium]|uniref:Polymerase nucleotidyl transferase domain-containing protein n=1 Tax=uncultured Thermomicrobiales bacterium TaxID=1645740 RepID=A0A6J4V8S3_9BACT|nr:MAG: hypothetical protein AVDCRST_MAG19-2871 [uncultured Thermomicrobiales bacterium]
MELFGTILADDFGPDSDVDFLATFSPEAERTLFYVVRMEGKLERLVGRRIDLITRRAVERSENRIRHHSILETAQSYSVSG